MTGFTVSANARGLKALNDRLMKLGKEEATKAGAVAMRAGAAKLRKGTIAKAPNSPHTTEGEIRTRHNKSGTTRKEVHGKIVNHVRVKKTKGTESTQVQYSVGINGAYHAIFVQFGSIHNTADPFMTRALDDAQQPIIDTVAKVLNKQLIKRGV